MDNRIKLTDTPATVTTKGQLSDTYPDAEDAPRYDLMKSYLIGLLSHQASQQEPTEYREGTIWYDKTKLNINLTDQWESLHTLLALPTIPQQKIRKHYSGKSTYPTKTIPIPEKLGTITNYKYTVWVNGLLWETGIITSCTIDLTTETPENCRYTVLLVSF